MFKYINFTARLDSIINGASYYSNFCLLLVFASLSFYSHSEGIASNSSSETTNKLTLSLSGGDNSLSSSRIAIVVGVSKYRQQPNKSHELQTLPYAVNDASMLSSVLSRNGYQVITLKDFQADKQYILDTIAALSAAENDPESSLIFTFSGHGFSRDGINYMALGNTDMSRVEDTALSVKQVKLALEQTGFKQRMLFIDACRNVPVRSTPDIESRYQVDRDSEGTAVMYSTAAGALSYEDSSINQGVFSYYLTLGLNGKAKNSLGDITIDSLFDYVNVRVNNHVLGLYNSAQMPYLAGERNGDFTLISSQFLPDIAENTNTGLPNGTDKESTLTATSSVKWKRIVIGIGLAVAGVLLASISSSDNSSNEPDPVTLVIPTP